MHLNQLRDEAYQNAIKHGWHEQEYSHEHWCMLIECEIAEAVEADRKNRHAEKSAFERDTMRALREMHLSGDAYETYQSSCFNTYIKDTVEDELADVVIRILDMCGLYNINLERLPKPFTVNDSDTDKALIQEIENQSMTEFAFSCTLRTIYICEDRIGWGQIQCLLHRIYLYSVIKGFDLEWYVNHKMHYNKSRKYKHGKNY